MTSSAKKLLQASGVLLLALALSSCVGGDQSLGDWLAAMSCDDQEVFRTAVRAVLEDDEARAMVQVGDLGSVDCSGSFDPSTTSVVLARRNSDLSAEIQDYEKIEICDGDAVLAHLTTGDVGKSDVPARLAQELVDRGFC